MSDSHGLRAVIVALALVATSCCPGAAPSWADAPATGGSPAIELGWLHGCWRSVDGDRVTIERWGPGPDGGLVGDAHTTRAGEVVHREYLKIDRTPTGLSYTASPSGQERTVFRSVELGARRLVFENPSHDYPQRISYVQTEPSHLDARIEGHDGGEAKSAEWHMVAVTCPP